MLIAHRQNLSADLADRIRVLITERRWKPGDRLNEVHLATELDVSRTPLREALSRLVSEGFIEVRPRRGFFVRQLSAEEIGHLYEIRNVLDPYALLLAGMPDDARLERLHELNDRFSRAASAAEAIEIDDAFHMELIGHCKNPLLLDLIRQHMTRTRVTEHSYMNESSNVETAVREHERILAALDAGDVRGAADALGANMRSALAPLAEKAEGELK